MIQAFEYLFVLSTIFIITVLPYVQLYKKEFILNINNKDTGLATSQWLALFIFIEMFTLKSLPLLTKIAVMTYFIMEFDFNHSSIN